VADAVVLARWEADPVKLSQVMDTMARLRHETARTSTVTSVMTLIIVAMNDADEDRAMAAVRILGGHHPARILIIRPEPAGPDGIGARVLIWGCQPVPTVDAWRVTVDQVCLTVRGRATGRLESIIEPFTLADVPVMIWYPGRLPDASSGLPAPAATVIVDSKEVGGREALPAIAALVRDRHAVIDLSWMRLTSWRELLAGLFDGPDFRGLLGAIRSGRVEGKPGPRHLLGGWLLSRLQLAPQVLTLADSVHAGIHLVASLGGVHATIEVVRIPGERLVRATATIQNGPARSTVVALPDDNLSWSLAQALTHQTRDRVWEEALAAALMLEP
jgi:glucose-6-phosphate dehydrogenase assembly protein OpcA